MSLFSVSSAKCLFCVPSCQCHHLHHSVGCCWTEQGQKRWDPESSTESSGSHPSSICHILQNSQKLRALSNTQNDGNYMDLISVWITSLLPNDDLCHLLWWSHVMCVCVCVYVHVWRNMFRNERVCNKRTGNQFRSVTHRWQSCPSVACTHTRTLSGDISHFLSMQISTKASIV